MVGRMEEIPEDVSRAFQDQKISIGGSWLEPFDIVKILLAITSSQATSCALTLKRNVWKCNKSGSIIR